MMIIIGLIFGSIIGFVIGGVKVAGELCPKLRNNIELADKHLQLYKFMCKWLYIKQENKSIISYFEENNYRRIAVYGLNFIGKALINELKGSGIDTAYGIDQNIQCIDGLKIYKPEDNLPYVDIIVITPITFYDDIVRRLSINNPHRTVSMVEILERVECFH